MLKRFCWVFLLLGLVGLQTTQAKKEPLDKAPLFYVVTNKAMLCKEPATSAAFKQLTLRDQVEVLKEGQSWHQVRTASGTVGYMRAEVLSNVWLRIVKADHKVYVYRGAELVRTIPADFGYNIKDDKVKQGSTQEPDHWRTPEGQFFITRKNPNSSYYKAFVLNYPTPKDAKRGLKQQLISKAEYTRIVKAAMNYETPPMNTQLGGWIEIHGQGTGGQADWTRGCIAIPNSQMDAIWALISRGTPVVIG